MKIVIDIPEEVYKASQIIDVKYEDVIQIPLEVIANGTPLPEGHGDLIDKDVVLDMMNHGILEDYITTMGGVIPADK